MVTPVRNGLDCSVCGVSLDDGAGRDGLCDDCIDLEGASIEVIESTGRYDFIYDAYVRIGADSKEEADARLDALDDVITAAGATLSIFDAFGIDDAQTGEELRPVG